MCAGADCCNSSEDGHSRTGKLDDKEIVGKNGAGKCRNLKVQLSDYCRLCCLSEIQLVVNRTVLMQSTLYSLNNNYTYSPNPLHTTTQIDNEVAHLTTLITDAYNTSSKKSTYNNNHFLPAHLKTLITHRNQARKAWQLFRDPPSKRLYNQLQSKLRREFHLHNQNTWENKLASLTTEDNSLWIAASRFKKELKSSSY
ncbi:hypothetical protein CEXT_347881 [Caerostris extrusa]|uniref:Uncharacterized protein n=1 Tax=Caerostris extrusa TaxID=172846 RepID=A0AAV4WJC0_CAEEX|nr:hypothetical protein CEXT_347881 [Caerostris extrusa]